MANRLTLLRILLTPFVAVALLASFPGWQLVSAGLVAGGALTDLLDGHIARRRNQITALGTLLDPIADKFFISTIFICLVARGLCPAWVAIVIVGREFAVTALRMVALQRGSSVPVNLLGKIKMHAQVYAALLVLAGAFYEALAPFGVLGLWIAGPSSRRGPAFPTSPEREASRSLAEPGSAPRRLLRALPEVFLGADAVAGLDGSRGFLVGEKRHRQVDVLGFEPVPEAGRGAGGARGPGGAAARPVRDSGMAHRGGGGRDGGRRTGRGGRCSRAWWRVMS